MDKSIDWMDAIIHGLQQGLARMPWETNQSDWFICICPEVNRVIFIENYLLAMCYKALQLPDHEKVQLNPEPMSDKIPGWARNFSAHYHELAVDIGRRYSEQQEIFALRDGTAMHGSIGDKVECRIGNFAGQCFVFAPRHEYGKSLT